MVLIEAMTKGLPIVSLDCPHGPAEIIRDGITGRLIPEDDLPAFSSALLELMDDPDQRARMGEQARLHAAQYQPEQITGAWLDLLTTLATRRALAGASAGPEEGA